MLCLFMLHWAWSEIQFSKYSNQSLAKQKPALSAWHHAYFNAWLPEERNNCDEKSKTECIPLKEPAVGTVWPMFDPSDPSLEFSNIF